MDPDQVRDAEMRIAREYLEMPGLRLTPSQTRKLCGLPGDLCEAALDALVQHDVLVQTSQGMFMLRTSSPRVVRQSA